jgi:mannan endo-1,4-beta-mannosidase
MKKQFYISFLSTLFFFSAKAVDIKSEAENAVLSGVNVTKAVSGYSGTGYITGFDNSSDQAVFTMQIPTTGLYELTIRYISSSGNKGVDIVVNSESSSGTLPQSSSFAATTLGKFYLTAGQTTVTVKDGWGYYDVDYIMFSSSSAVPVTKPAKTLVNSKSTCLTKSLFSMLVDEYGTNIISGQHEFGDINYIYSNTGKYPALGNFDLIEYSPTRIAHGSNPNGTSENIITNWSKKNNGRGITSLMWHWNAPADLYDGTGDQEWYFGFYTKGTFFDLQAALANPNSTNYKLLISDMDAIATQLKKFRDANIPVIWRPLHEAAGGWFWWGAKGAGPFKQLWQLMYDLYTNYHGLNNLIWVFTSDGQTSWYPGDQYVDVVGMDLYEAAGSSLSSDWDMITQLYGSKKLITLSESGSLPVPDKVRAYGTWWSWFNIWSGSFIEGVDKNTLKQIYTDKNVLTVDEMPDWPNYSCVVTDLESEAPLNAEIATYPNPFTKELHIKAEGTFDYTLYTLAGHALLNGSGQNELSLENDLPAGIYLLKVKSQTTEENRKLIKN